MCFFSSSFPLRQLLGARNLKCSRLDLRSGLLPLAGLTLRVEPSLHSAMLKRASHCSRLVGLLTFPSLLYLPDDFNSSIFQFFNFSSSVALYKQTLQRGITAAGTVPDSHRIPFHHSATRTPDCRIHKLRCKDSANRAKHKINRDFFISGTQRSSPEGSAGGPCHDSPRTSVSADTS